MHSVTVSSINSLCPCTKELLQSSVKDFCDSIQAIHKIFKEDGKVVIGVYVVLDKVENFTQDIVLNSLSQVIEMTEKTYQFIGKTF